jgi:hypothetical protein
MKVTLPLRALICSYYWPQLPADKQQYILAVLADRIQALVPDWAETVMPHAFDTALMYK